MAIIESKYQPKFFYTSTPILNLLFGVFEHIIIIDKWLLICMELISAEFHRICYILRLARLLGIRMKLPNGVVSLKLLKLKRKVVAFSNIAMSITKVIKLLPP